MSSFNNQGELEFPLNYVLKVIFTGAEEESSHTAGLESLLDSLTIPRGKPPPVRVERGGMSASLFR